MVRPDWPARNPQSHDVSGWGVATVAPCTPPPPPLQAMATPTNRIAPRPTITALPKPRNFCTWFMRVCVCVCARGSSHGFRCFYPPLTHVGFGAVSMKCVFVWECTRVQCG